MEWGNLVFVGLVIAQLVPAAPDSSFNFFFVSLGLIGLVGAYFVAEQIMKGGGS